MKLCATAKGVGGKSQLSASSVPCQPAPFHLATRATHLRLGFLIHVMGILPSALHPFASLLCRPDETGAKRTATTRKLCAQVQGLGAVEGALSLLVGGRGGAGVVAAAVFPGVNVPLTPQV